MRLEFTPLRNSSPIAIDYCSWSAKRRAFNVERMESVRINGCAFNSSPSATGSARRSGRTVGFNLRLNDQLSVYLDNFPFTIVDLKMKSGTLKTRSFYLDELFSNFSWDLTLDDKRFEETRADKRIHYGNMWQKKSAQVHSVHSRGVCSGIFSVS